MNAVTDYLQRPQGGPARPPHAAAGDAGRRRHAGSDRVRRSSAARAAARARSRPRRTARQAPARAKRRRWRSRRSTPPTPSPRPPAERPQPQRRRLPQPVHAASLRDRGRSQGAGSSSSSSSGELLRPVRRLFERSANSSGGSSGSESSGGSSKSGGSGGSVAGRATTAVAPSPPSRRPSIRCRSCSAKPPAARPAEGSSGLKPYENLRLLTPLPSKKSPSWSSVASAAGARRRPSRWRRKRSCGPGKCLPSAFECQAIQLRAGQNEQLQYLPARLPERPELRTAARQHHPLVGLGGHRGEPPQPQSKAGWKCCGGRISSRSPASARARWPGCSSTPPERAASPGRTHRGLCGAGGAVRRTISLLAVSVRLITAGESHGPGLTCIVEGLPAGLELVPEAINRDMARRQLGHGRGGRMKIERDRAEVDRRGAPRAHARRPDRAADREPRLRQLGGADEPVAGGRGGAGGAPPRPGHADLAGMMKYSRARSATSSSAPSARETAARVAGGAVLKAFLRVARRRGPRTWCGSARCGRPPDGRSRLADFAAVDESPVRCLDAAASRAMVARDRRARRANETLGGVFEVLAFGLRPGLGSHVSWEARLDGRMGRAFFSIQAIKGV